MGEEGEKKGADELQKETKEIQATILPIPPKNGEKVPKEEFFSILKMISPGTNFRTALDGIVKTGKGAIIVIENEKVAPLIDGGFRINCRFTPQRIVELSKMDGAMILSKDLKKLNYANVLLTPSSAIKTSETGTRHKAAERTAKQAECPVIAISERRHEIALFYKNMKHIVKNTDELLRKSNEHIQLLEKQRELFDHYLEKLTKAELKDFVSVNHAIGAIQKGRIIQKIAEDLKKNLVELGNESTLLKTRLKEITQNVEKETDLVVKDYSKIGLKKSKVLLESLNYDEILDAENIRRVLAREQALKSDAVKGWRILSKTSLLEPEIAGIIKEAGNIGRAINSGIKFYSQLLGEERAKILKDEIERIKRNY